MLKTLRSWLEAVVYVAAFVLLAAFVGLVFAGLVVLSFFRGVLRLG